VSDIVNANASLVAEQQADKAEVEEKKVATEKAIQQQTDSVVELEATANDLDGQQLAKEVLVIDLALEKAETQGERDNLVSLREEAQAQAVAYAEQQEAISESVATALSANQNDTVDSTVSLAATEAVDTATPAESTSNADTASQAAPSSSASTAASTASSSSTTSSSASNSNSQSSSSSSTAQAAPAPKPEPAPAPAPAAGGSVIGIANGYLGVPYSWGGTTPSGFDCSGFTQYVFAQAGISIGRNTNAQYAQATPVSNPQPGDLVFFSHGGGITHVGIYTGGGQFIGAQTSTGVAYASVHSGYWGSLFVGYGRI
jgi:cell wall-associated NlpC family hydrolase